MKTRNLLIALLVLFAAAVAGCGGASDEKGEAAASDGSGEKGTLSLVAYSTPQVVYDELIPAFGETSAGERRRLQDVVRRVRRPGARRRGRPEGRRRDVLDRARHDAARRRRHRRPDLEGRAERGPRHDLGRLLRRARGQPEEHQDLGGPAQAGHRGADAEPVQLGRGEVEPARRLRPRVGRRQEPRGRARLRPRADHRARQGPGQVGPRGAAELHRRQRRRAPVLRVRGDHREQERREARVRDPGRHDQDQHRHRDDEGRARRGEVVPRLRPLRAGPGEVRRVGLPAGQRGRARGQQGPVPRPARPVHDRRPRRLGEGQRRAVRHRGRRDRRRSRRKRECRPPSEHARPAPAGAPGRPAGRPRARRLDALAEPDRPAAAGRRGRPLDRGRLRCVLERGQQPPGGLGAALHAARLARRDGHQRRSPAR